MAKDYRNQDLRSSSFDGQNLSYSDFSGADLSGASFRNATLLKCDFRRATLDRADFTGARMGGSSLFEATANGTDFKSADMKSSNLQKIEARRAGFSLAMLKESSLDGGDFREADFKGADLRRVSAKKAAFDNAKMRSSLMEFSDFSNSSLRSVDIRLAEEVVRANFSGADLSDAKYDDSDDLHLRSQATKMPKSKGWFVSEEIAGFVVNPKNGEVIASAWEKDRGVVRIFRASGESVGTGYFGDEDELSYQLTGYLRSHTPSGVKGYGGGYGTCLYTSLALIASLMSREVYESPFEGPLNDGISSVWCEDYHSRTSGKEGTAGHWWGNASQRFGITKRQEWLNEEVEEHTGRSYGDCIVDIYPYPSAVKHNLVLMEAKREALNSPGRLSDRFKVVGSGKQIVAANWGLWGRMGGYESAAGQLFEEVIAMLKKQRKTVTEDQIADMKLRFESGTDVPPKKKASRGSKGKVLNPGNALASLRRSLGWDRF